MEDKDYGTCCNPLPLGLHSTPAWHEAGPDISSDAIRHMELELLWELSQLLHFGSRKLPSYCPFVIKDLWRNPPKFVFLRHGL